MNSKTVQLLACPVCKSQRLTSEKFKGTLEHIHDGRLICSECKNWFRIEDEIVDLLPLSLRRGDLYQRFVKKYNLSSSAHGLVRGRRKISGELSQIVFFKESVQEYEKKVVNSPYYKILDKLVFDDWVKRKLAPGDLVLDLGCGTARQAIPMASAGVFVIGVDISEEMLVLAAKKLSKMGLLGQVDLIVADAQDPPVKNNAFDGFVFYGTLHHLSRPKIAIKNASLKLVDGGKVFTLDPNLSPLRFMFDILMAVWRLYREDTGEGSPLSAKSLLRWFESCGILGTVKLSTYSPPHLFYFLDRRLGLKVLTISDAFFNKVSFLRNMGGVIMFEGEKIS